MPDDELVDSVTLLDRPMDADGWSAERVIVARTRTGDVILRVGGGGKSVQSYAGDFIATYQRTWRIAAGDRPRLREALAAEISVDVSALGAEHALLEALCTFLAPTDEDEGTDIADRLLGWLAAKSIPYGFDSEASLYD